jgi:hypothetical protein
MKFTAGNKNRLISERIADTIASKSWIPALGTLCDRDGKRGLG